MKISVIIPCFNEKNTIEKIINKIISQKDLNIEIIVIDDFSTDGTRDILKGEIRKKITNCSQESRSCS